MKKRDFLKLLKENKHPIIKEGQYIRIVSFVYLLMVALFLFLMNQNILPNNMTLIFLIVAIFVIAIPIIAVDIKRDMKINQLFEYYKKENKISEEKPSVNKLLIVIIIIEFLTLLGCGAYILVKTILPSLDNNLIMTTNNGEKIEMTKHGFDDNSFYLKVPKNFRPMSEEMIKIKYPNGNPPDFVFTNEGTTVNVAVSLTETPLKDDDVEEYLKLVKQTFISIGNVIDTNIYKKNGHSIAEIELMTSAVDTDIYSYMIVFSDKGKLRIATFNCTKDLQEEWQEVADFIMKSIKFA